MNLPVRLSNLRFQWVILKSSRFLVMLGSPLGLVRVLVWLRMILRVLLPRMWRSYKTSSVW
jgi:hypothetical protein